jgi:DNA-binding MarR family transcriptional regulator
MNQPIPKEKTMSTTPTFSAAVLGQTEKALNAILLRQLSGTGLTELQWVTLSFARSGGGSVNAAQLADAIKVSEAEAHDRIAELAAAGLLGANGDEGSSMTITDAGERLHSEIGAAVGPITQRMWGDLPEEDLDAAGRVLSTILGRANAELAGEAA